MRYKGRFIKDVQIVNIPGENVTEIELDNGMKELRREIDVMTIVPTVKKKQKNKIDLRSLSIIISMLCVGFTFTGLFTLPEVCAPVLIGNFMLGFFILCGWEKK